MAKRKHAKLKLPEPEDLNAVYCAVCPKCKGDHTLEVVSGGFSATGMTLTEDGFSFVDAQQVATENERVVCNACKGSFALSELTR